MDFDPALLRAFVVVNSAGSFTRAAERLHLTQSAVSHQIRRLEEQVGRPLLHRTTRRLTLTEDGQDFLPHATQILEAIDALARRFRPSTISGVVRFGVPETFMGEQLPTMLGQFARAFPDVRLDVNVGTYLDLRAMMAAGELDLAVVLAEPAGESDGTVLRRTKFSWVAARNFDVPESASLPMAFAPVPCVDRRVGVAALNGTSVAWHVAFTSPSQEGIRTAVLAGIAIAVQLQSDVKPGMRILDGQYGLPALPNAEFTLLWRDGEPTPAMKEFGQLLLAMSEPLAMPERPAKKSSH